MSEAVGSIEDVGPLLQAGRLTEAVAAVSASVKAKPTLVADRILLAELLVLEGAFEKADNHLKLVADQAPAELLAISQMRWLLRATEARRAWYDSGAVPTFLGEPTSRQRDVMRLALLARDGETDQVTALRSSLEDEPVSSLSVDGGAAQPLRDVCDLSQHGFEALSLDGRYLWIAPEQITDMRLSPPKRPRDLLWRKADTVLEDGREATFFLIAQYWAPESTEAQRVAKETGWIEEPGGLVRGRGQKVVLVGEGDRNLLEIQHIAKAKAA